MQDLSNANVSKPFFVDGTTVQGGVNRTAGSVGTIPPDTFHNIQLIEFQNVLAQAGDSLRSTPAGDDGKQLVKAIATMIEDRMNPIGTIVTHAGSNFLDTIKALTGEWAIANGDSLIKEDYPELWGIIGDTYSGDDIQDLTFKIPAMIGRFVQHGGAGDTGGDSQVILTKDNLPPHEHQVPLTGGTAPTTSGNNVWIEGGFDKETLGIVDGQFNPHAFSIIPPYIKMYPYIRIK